MGKEIFPFSLSAGEHKIMAHFVVKIISIVWLRLCRAGRFVLYRRDDAEYISLAFKWRVHAERFHSMNSISWSESTTLVAVWPFCSQPRRAASSLSVSP